MAEAARASADPRDPRPARLLRRVARHPGRSLTLERRHPVDRRPQRHGQDDALQHHRRPQARALRLDQPRRPRDLRPRAARHRPARRRLCAAGPAGLAEPDGRRASPPGAAGGADATWTVERVYQTFPRLAERRAKRRLAAFRRRAADAGDRPRAARQSAPPRHGRADRGPRPDHRRPGRDDAGRSSPRTTTCRSCSSSRTSASRPPSPSTSRSWSTAASTGSWPAALAADRDLQQRLLGVGRHDDEARPSAGGDSPRPARVAEAAGGAGRIASERGERRRSAPNAVRRLSGRALALSERWSVPATSLRAVRSPKRAQRRAEGARDLFEMPLAERIGRTALVVGTFDTKGRELKFIRDALRDSASAPAPSISPPRQAVERRRDAAGSGERASARRQRRLLRRPRQGGRRRWRGLRALDRPPARHRRRHLGRRLGQHLARHRRHARAAARRPEDHDLDRRLRRCRPLCRRRATS